MDSADSSGQPVPPPAAMALSCILSLVICCGNVLTVIAVMKYQVLQVISNIFIVLLALSDILVGLVLPYCEAVLSLRVMENSEALCLGCLSFITFAAAVSLGSLTMMSLERYFIINHPFTYQRIVSTKRVISICMIYCIVILSVTASIWVSNDWTNSSTCVPVNIWSTSFSLAFFILAPIYIITCLVAYFRIFNTALKQQKRIAADTRNSGDIIAGQKKVAKMMVMVLGILLLSWFPFVVCHYYLLALRLMKEDYIVTGTLLKVYNVTLHLMCINSAVNPIIYAWQNKDFRTAYKRLVTCCCK